MLYEILIITAPFVFAWAVYGDYLNRTEAVQMAAFNFCCIKLVNVPEKGDYFRCRKGCENQPEYRTQYSYVTGRAGRVSSAQKDVCKEHAEKFCKKHGIDIDNLPEVSYSDWKAERDAFAAQLIAIPIK